MSDRLFFSIGRIQIQLTCDNGILLQLLSKVIKLSILNHTPHFTIKINTKEEKDPIFELQTPSLIQYNFKSTPMHYLGAWNGIRTISQYIALKNDILFLHGSSICKDGTGHVFYGKSGAGKSTIAKSAKMRGYDVLGDDTAVLECKGESVTIYPSPFDKLVSIKGSVRLVRLKSLTNIIKSEKNYTEPLNYSGILSNILEENIASEALLGLLQSRIEAPTMQAKIHQILQKLYTIPAYHLFFKKDCDFFHLYPYGKQ